MSASASSFEYPTSLQEYAIPEGDYLNQHHEVHEICTGAVVFNDEGKLLLVQRAKEEKAFPNAWVSFWTGTSCNVCVEKAIPYLLSFYAFARSSVSNTY